MFRVFWLLLLTSCATLPFLPAPEKLQPWTTVLREQQPENAFAVVYKIGARHLVFVAAQHENSDDSLTFRMIRDAYATFKFETVIAEGFPTSWGVNPDRILDYASKNGARDDGFVEGGETVPTVFGAQQQSAALLGGEADDLVIKTKIMAEGFSTNDLLGFYVLRNIPQWIGERKIKDAEDPRLPSLVAAALDRNRYELRLPDTTIPGFTEWAAWYQATNGKPISAAFVTEEVGPLADGPFGTNKIAYAVSRARDVYLHNLIIAHLNAAESVLVVFGGSHLMIHRPALDAALGLPCYVGVSPQRAIASCR